MNMQNIVLVISNDISRPDVQTWPHILSRMSVVTKLLDFKDLRELDQDNYALVIIDILNHSENILPRINKLRSNMDVPILYLSQVEKEIDMLNLYDSGIDDLLCRPVSLGLLIAKVRIWLQWANMPITRDTGILKVADYTLDQAKQIVHFKDKSVNLTYLESRLLYTLMRQPGIVIPREAIVHDVWGPLVDDTTLVKHVVYRLRRKIENDPSSPEHIVFVPSVGYEFVP